MNQYLSEFDHPAWFALGGTLAGYVAILIVMFVVLFVAPFLIYSALL
ncbi:MAG: hypothetical protein ACI9PP_002305 [Halobacteriales archaeon]|jgi:hypothetical protein